MMKFSLSLFLVSIFFYTFFSFSLTDPNLVITTWEPYWNFQQWMWRTFFENSQLLSWTFGVIVTLLVISYLGMVIHLIKNKNYPVRVLIASFTLVVGVLFFSYNALSHDVFNYMFNAKMVMVYDADPHQQVALNFPQDEWVRFMHNTHTPAPYGEGWTALSLFPYILGMEKFVITWLNFRLFSVFSYISLIYILWKSTQELPLNKRVFGLSLLAFNPLLLIEIVSNSHNDLWMMVPALLALLLSAGKLPHKKSDIWAKFVLSGVLLGLSISIKFASVVLIPLWLGLWLLHWLPSLNQGVFKPLDLVKTHWPLIASLVLFIPLLTGRSQLFHPWYLTWSLIWLPLFDWKSDASKIWAVILVSFSISSLYRYIPWLLAGNFSGPVLLQQQTITWIGGIVLAIVLFILKKRLLSK